MARLFTDAYASVTDPFLRRALDLAEKGRGTTSPNPLVGCVLVRDGEIVGEGYHERAGGPHAEGVALAAAGEAARGATAYITLEPCNHVGRMPACSPALSAAGVSRVVVGMRDPNPTVEGGGAEALQAAGVAVEFAVDSAPFEELNAAWLTWVQTGRPRVRVKVALTLDGHATMAAGTRSELTGEEARKLTMLLRYEADAVMVGAATVAVDDPSLGVRDGDGQPTARQPRRVVLAGDTGLPAQAAMFADGLGEVTVLASDGAATDVPPGAHLVTYARADGLRGALSALGGQDVVDLLVEAGPRLLSALWDGDLIDELVIYHAGGMAGAQAPPLYAQVPPLFVGESPGGDARLAARMGAIEAGVAGGDAVTVWRRRPTTDSAG